MLSDFDRQNIGLIIAGHGDWFSAQLLRLINKATPEHRARLRLGFPEEVAAVEQWMMQGDDEETDDDPPPPELGACCACEREGQQVRNIIMLDKKAVISGHGWGCCVCGLPTDGAVYVICDECFSAKRPPKYACRGYPKEDGRIAIAMLTEPFEHDESKHDPEELQ